VWTYEPGSLVKLQPAGEAATPVLRSVLQELGVAGARIGFERGPASEPASYVAMHLFGGSMVSVIHSAVPNAELVPADDVLAALATVKTEYEVSRIRRSCRIAENAYGKGMPELKPARTEVEVAAAFRDPLSTFGTGFEDATRADGEVFCMSGPNSAKAFGAYARSTQRRISGGDLVLVHCNSYADGYWTDITRTYCVGDPDDRSVAMYEAVLAARNAALKVIAPGVPAREVDRAAREKMTRRGFGNEFKHSTGHGVGFSAISANARPRLHPESEEVLEPGMVFNVEPAAYVDGFGGIRHCDMVAVTDTGYEILTPFQDTLHDLLITDEQLAERHA
jgi:Xaa-Pro aminopeptidase